MAARPRSTLPTLGLLALVGLLFAHPLDAQRNGAAEALPSIEEKTAGNLNGEEEQLLLRLARRRRRGLEDVRRDHPLGQLVDPGEVGAAADAGHLPHVEQQLERQLAVVPVSPRALRRVALVEVGGDDRSLVADVCQHLLDVSRSPAPESGSSASASSSSGDVSSITGPSARVVLFHSPPLFWAFRLRA